MQLKRFLILLCVMSATSVSGCARLEFFSDKNLEGVERGVKFYYPKPYLLVARTKSTEKPEEIKVIYLPDMSEPQYAKLKSGYGAAELSLAFENGILTSVGQKTDTKIPETITSLGSLSGMIPKPPPAPGQVPPAFELYEIDNSSGTTILKRVQLGPE